MRPRVTLILIVVGAVLLVTGNGATLPCEYSNDLDEQAIAGGGAHDGLQRGMVLYTQPRDFVGGPNPQNIRQLNTSQEVDAIANLGDAYFPQLVRNQAELLVSFKLPNPPPFDPNDPFSNATYFERWNVVRGVKWTQADYSNPDPAGDLEDLDGLEIWGPPNASDVNRYSVKGDWATPTATSVFNYVPGGPDTPYISQAVIANAVAALGFVGDPDSVDVDALMVRDYGRLGIFDDKDEILFSIRATGNFDGGEIIILRNGTPPAWLNHGGHLWDTSFDVGAAFGVPVEEVDAIEALNMRSNRYWASLHWWVIFLASGHIEPSTRVTLTAVTPASMALSKDDTTETVDLRWASAEIDIGPAVGDISTVEIVSGSGEFEGFSWNGLPIPVSEFTIEPSEDAGTVTWSEGNMKINASIHVSAIGFIDIETRAFASGQITVPPDSIYLTCGEAMDESDFTAGVNDGPDRIQGSGRYLVGSPNPFGPATTIEYEIFENTHVRIAIYDVEGQLVCTLVDEQVPAGRYDAVWDGRSASGAMVASGVYYCQMEAGPLRQMNKLVVLK